MQILVTRVNHQLDGGAILFSILADGCARSVYVIAPIDFAMERFQRIGFYNASIYVDVAMFDGEQNGLHR